MRGGAGRCLAAVCTTRLLASSGLVGLVGPSGPLSPSDSTSRSFDRRRRRKQFLQPGALPVRFRLRLGRWCWRRAPSSPPPGERKSDRCWKRLENGSDRLSRSLCQKTVMTVMQSLLKVATSRFSGNKLLSCFLGENFSFSSVSFSFLIFLTGF